MNESQVKQLIAEELRKLHGASGIVVNHSVISASPLDQRLKRLELNNGTDEIFVKCNFNAAPTLIAIKGRVIA